MEHTEALKMRLGSEALKSSPPGRTRPSTVETYHGSDLRHRTGDRCRDTTRGPRPAPQQKCCCSQLPLTGPCRPDLVQCSRGASRSTWRPHLRFPIRTNTSKRHLRDAPGRILLQFCNRIPTDQLLKQKTSELQRLAKQHDPISK